MGFFENDFRDLDFQNYIDRNHTLMSIYLNLFKNMDTLDISFYKKYFKFQNLYDFSFVYGCQKKFFWII